MTQAVSSYPQFACHLVTNALNAFTIYDFFDDGLAEVLGLKTYTHGTAPKCNYNILWTGADPRFGGNVKLGETGMRGAGGTGDWDCRTKFFVATDIADHSGELNTDCTLVDYIVNFASKIQPRLYAMVASIAVCKNDGCDDPTISVLCGCSCATFSPTIKFRFLPEEAHTQDFQNDPTIGGNQAAFTKKPISPDHIGLYGTLTRGLQGSILERISNDPERLARGLTKIAVAVALLAVAVFGATYAPALITFWLMWDAAVCVGRVAIPLILGNISTLEEPA